MPGTSTESARTAEGWAYLMSLVNQSNKAHGEAIAQAELLKDPVRKLETLNTGLLDPHLGFSVAALGWKTTE